MMSITLRSGNHTPVRAFEHSLKDRDMTDKSSPIANQPAGYVPPNVWVWDKENGSQSRTSIARYREPRMKKTLDRQAPVSALFACSQWPEGHDHARRTARAAGYKGAEYDAWLIRIGESESQFSSGFVAISN
jgi:GST-like protein